MIFAFFVILNVGITQPPAKPANNEDEKLSLLRQ